MCWKFGEIEGGIKHASGQQDHLNSTEKWETDERYEVYCLKATVNGWLTGIRDKLLTTDFPVI